MLRSSRHRRCPSLIAGLVIAFTGLVGAAPPAGAVIPDSTWTAQTSGTTQNLHDVVFEDRLLGFAVGDAGTILKTVDGGAHWTAKTSGTTADLYAVTEVGFGCGSGGANVCVWAAGSGGAMVHSDDGGETWCAQTTNTTATLRGITNLGPNDVIAVGASGTIIRSGLGGTNASYCGDAGYYDLPDSGTLNSLFGVGSSVGGEVLAVGGGGAIRQDADPAWTGVIAGVSQRLLAFASACDAADCSTDAKDFVVGAAGTTIRRRAGAGAFAPVSSVTTTDLNDVSFPVTSANGWVAGAGGVIRHTANGGDRWDTETSPTTNNLDGVWMVDDTHGYAVGVGGTILTRGHGPFRVNSTADAAEAGLTVGDGVCETARGTGVCTLRAAIQEANAASGDDVIGVPAGVYTLSLATPGEDRAATGDLDITGDLILVGAGDGLGAGATVIDGNLTDRVFDVSAGTSTFKDMTIERGKPESGASGGGIRAMAPVEIVDSTLTANQAGDATLVPLARPAGDGGAVSITGSGNTLTLDRVTVDRNLTADSARGGGLNVVQADLVVDLSTFSGNQAGTRGGKGGAVYIDAGPASRISGSTFGGSATGGANRADNGAGLYNGASSATNPVLLESDTFNGNAAAVRGGAIGQDRGATVLSNVTVDGNTALTNGGGGISKGGGTVTSANTIVADNTGGDCDAAITSLGYNLDTSVSSRCDLRGTGDKHASPRLGSLADNGGPTETMKPLAGSPAVDAGSPEAVLTDPPCEAVDQRGLDRPIKGRSAAICDIGSMELVPAGPLTPVMRLPSSPEPSKFGGYVTVMAMLGAPAGLGSMPPPTGRVTFTEGRTAALVTLVDGSARYATKALSVGSHTFTVSYPASRADVTHPAYNAATDTVTVTVQKADTATSLSSSVNPAASGQAVTYTATVTVVRPGAGTPTGTVTFKDGETTIGSAAVDSAGHAALTATLDGGTHLLAAAYGGDGNFATSTSATLNQSVGFSDTTPTTSLPPLEGARQGYRLIATDGGVFSFGADFKGSTGGIRLNQPIVGSATTPSGAGYWLVASDGGIFAFGNAGFFGSTGAIRLNKPVVGMASTPTGGGYWLVASDGGIFAFGDARFFGSTGAMRLNQPVVAMASTPSGGGYWLVASDGGVFSFGDAAFAGSTGAIRLNRPIVGMAASPTGNGYWLVATDGGIFAFGAAQFQGSTGAIRLNQPVVGMDRTSTGGGYWLVASDGGVFAFGDARFIGSMGGERLNQPVVTITSLR